mmetsp:Transcript_16541/g.28116  ORF Transcript_16541/g.28116 Transcript_16541/m.28116 type:complete len:188 (-) Transcript_16541:432-995(-)
MMSGVCPNQLGYCENKNKLYLYLVRWTKDGKKMVVSAGKGKIIQFDVMNFQETQSQDVHEKQVQAMEWTNNHKFLVTGDKDGNVVYSNSKIVKKNKFEAHTDSPINEISFSMSSIKFATCSGDRTAKVWDFVTSKKETEFKEHNSEVTSCNWHPFQALIATGSTDKTLRVWDPRNNTGKSLFQLQAH